MHICCIHTYIHVHMYLHIYVCYNTCTYAHIYPMYNILLQEHKELYGFMTTIGIASFYLPASLLTSMCPLPYSVNYLSTRWTDGVSSLFYDFPVFFHRSHDNISTASHRATLNLALLACLEPCSASCHTLRMSCSVTLDAFLIWPVSSLEDLKSVCKFLPRISVSCGCTGFHMALRPPKDGQHKGVSLSIDLMSLDSWGLAGDGVMQASLDLVTLLVSLGWAHSHICSQSAHWELAFLCLPLSLLLVSATCPGMFPWPQPKMDMPQTSFFFFFLTVIILYLHILWECFKVQMRWTYIEEIWKI